MPHLVVPRQTLAKGSQLSVQNLLQSCASVVRVVSRAGMEHTGAHVNCAIPERQCVHDSVKLPDPSRTLDPLSGTGLRVPVEFPLLVRQDPDSFLGCTEPLSSIHKWPESRAPLDL